MRFLSTVWLTAAVFLANPILGSLSKISLQATGASNPTDEAHIEPFKLDGSAKSQSEDSVSVRSLTAASLSTTNHNSVHLGGRDLRTQDDFNELKKDITTFVLPTVNTYLDSPDKETADNAIAQVTSIYKNAQVYSRIALSCKRIGLMLTYGYILFRKLQTRKILLKKHAIPSRRPPPICRQGSHASTPLWTCFSRRSSSLLQRTFVRLKASNQFSRN